MDERGRPYGSGDLTPDVIRNARFAMRGDGYDPAEVHEFLERVASAMEVLASTDVAQAMRRELQRNSEISSRVVLAGQETAERLRAQAAEDARAIIEDTKRLAEQLRDASREEVERTRRHIDEMRTSFAEELREVYDRIGASLYRFEHATRAARAEAEAAAAAQQAAEHQPSYQVPGQPEAPPAHGGWGAATEPAPSEAWGEPAPAMSQHEPGSLPPAYTQLQGADFSGGPPVEDAHDDAPPAEGEPLVDLRHLHQQEAPEEMPAPEEEPAPPDETWHEPAAPAAPEPGPEGGAEQPLGMPDLTGAVDEQVAEAGTGLPEPGPYVTVADPQEPAGADAPVPPPAEPAVEVDPAEGGWLLPAEPLAEEVPVEAPPEPAAEAAPEEVPEAVPEAAPEAGQPAPHPDDDARAEALIAGLGQVLDNQAEPAPLPEPPSLQPEAEQGPDPQALMQFVLESVQAGQPREAIEAYLRDSLGIADPAAVVDHALSGGSAQ